MFGYGCVYLWEWLWYFVYLVLRDACFYMVLFVELFEVGGVRMVGNLVGDLFVFFVIGDAVEFVFEDHNDADVLYMFVQWCFIAS